MHECFISGDYHNIPQYVYGVWEIENPRATSPPPSIDPTEWSEEKKQRKKKKKNTQRTNQMCIIQSDISL